jgi:polysaccharide deacetylase family protein (PEP-CTERM system associated)
MLNALTIDVEEYFQVSAFEDRISRDAWDSLPSRVEASTRLLYDVLESRGVHGTFFFLGWIAERHPSLVREAAERGHEIACHGYDHRLVYDLTPERFAADLRRAREAIEQAAGARVRAYRAPSFSITRRNLWAFDALADEGFEVDSSVFPVVHDRYGMPGWERGLHTVADGRLIEAPLTTVKLGPLVLPCAGGGYYRLYPYTLTRGAIRQVNRRERRPAIVYLHPWEFDPDQPRMGGSLLKRWRHYNGIGRSRRRLERLLDDLPFGRLADVVGSWRRDQGRSAA